jgi:C4-type Zn-finger protein
MSDKEAQVPAKECPLCCDTMRLKSHERIERVPGSGQTVKHLVKEWECPECSYEEEFDPDE